MNLGCCDCHTEKPETEFSPNPHNPGRNYRQSICRECARIRYRKHRAGLAAKQAQPEGDEVVSDAVRRVTLPTLAWISRVDSKFPELSRR